MWGDMSVARGHRCPPGHGPLTLRDTIIHTSTSRVNNSATGSIPTLSPTSTMAQHSSIPPTWTKCLLDSRRCAGCQPCGEQDRPSHSDKCPPLTTHRTAHSHTHTAQCAHGLSQTPTQIKQLPHTHTVTGLYRRSSTHLRPPYTAPQERLPHHHQGHQWIQDYQHS